MKQRVFIDQNGEGLIVQRKDRAVYFLRETDLNIAGYVSPFWPDRDPVVDPTEMKRTYEFSEEAFAEFVEHIEGVGQAIWKNFKIKEEDSLSSNYTEYYDKELDSEGYLSLKIGATYVPKLLVEGPLQPKTENSNIRLYKFTKRKLEAFVFDLKLAKNKNI